LDHGVLCLGLVVGGYELRRRVQSGDEPVFLMLRIVLEQDTLLSSKFNSIPQVRGIVMCLILLFMTLTNAYRGILTAHSTTPHARLQLELIWESIDKGFKLLVQVPKSERTSQKLGKWARGGNFTIRRDVAISNLGYHSNLFANLQEHFWQNIRHTESRRRDAASKLYDSLDLLPTAQFNVIPELLKCNKRILVGENLDLEKVRKAHPDLGDELYLGKDAFMSHPLTWAMGSSMWDRGNYVYLRFQAIIQSGILDKLHKGNSSTRNIPTPPPKLGAMSTKHNFFITAFILIFSWAGISIVVFLSERVVMRNERFSTKTTPFSK